MSDVVRTYMVDSSLHPLKCTYVCTWVYLYFYDVHIIWNVFTVGVLYVYSPVHTAVQSAFTCIPNSKSLGGVRCVVGFG